MSNPLALFRKYQKAMLAVAAVGAMLAFGILPTVSSYLDSSSGGPSRGSNEGNPVVATWNGQQLRQSEIQGLVGRRQQLLMFQQAAQQMANERGVSFKPGIIPQRLDAEGILETLLYAEQAAELGVVVTDDAVVQHLEGYLAGGVINRNELAALLNKVTRGQLSQSALLEGYRMEMAANRLRVLSGGGAYNGFITEIATTPAQALKYHEQLNRRMEAQVLEIPAADYVAEVTAEPTDAEVQELYEQYKDQIATPASKEPGFRQPKRITISWLKADFPEILKRETAKLTEDELKKYYEDNKESYKKLSLPGGDDESSDDADGENEAAEDTPEYQAFEDVREDIAVTLARPNATDFVRDAMTQAMDEMRKYYEDFEFWQATKSEGDTPPAPPSVSEMGTRLGLQSGTMPMISFFEAEDYEIGRAEEFQQNLGRFITFGEKAFRPSLAKFSPEELRPLTDSPFVYWKTDEKDSYVPDLKEARPAIVTYWRLQKALEKAVQRGEAIAAELKANNQSLKVLFEEDSTKEVAETGEFTWMTYGAMNAGAGAPRISQVVGVEFAGEKFMEDVAKLSSGETVVTVNRPKTKAYVVYMNAITSSKEDLQQRFLTESSNAGILTLSVSDEYETASSWKEGLVKKLDFEVKEPEEEAN